MAGGQDGRGGTHGSAMQTLSRKTVLVALALSVWAATVCAAVLPFFASHFVVFRPEGAAEASVRPGAWALTHVLGQGCACSQTVVPYLLKRGPIDAHEKVLFFGDAFPLAKDLEARGFEVELRDPSSLDRKQFRAVPFLVIANSKGDVVYTGGYSEHRVTPDTAMQDVAILERLRANQPSDTLPVIGCAVSAQYRALLDPLGVKTLGATP